MLSQEEVDHLNQVSLVSTVDDNELLGEVEKASVKEWLDEVSKGDSDVTQLLMVWQSIKIKVYVPDIATIKSKILYEHP